MQNVIIKKSTFDFFQKEKFLTLEEAQWFVQSEGFIPLPRKAKKENISVIFLDASNPLAKYISLYFFKKKILSYRFSNVINDGEIIGKILSLELDKDNSDNEYFFY